MIDFCSFALAFALAFGHSLRRFSEDGAPFGWRFGFLIICEGRNLDFENVLGISTACAISSAWSRHEFPGRKTETTVDRPINGSLEERYEP